MSHQRVIVKVAVSLAVALPGVLQALAVHPGSRVHNGRVGVIVELVAPGAAQVWASRVREAGSGAMHEAASPDARAQWVAEAQAQVALVDGEQRALLGSLLAPPVDGTVVFRTQRVLNAIGLEVDEASIPAIERLPGVKAVYPLVQKALGNSTSVPWIHAPQAWSGSATGRGVRVGIIDSGVDYLHRDFGGSGVYSGQQFDDSSVPWTAKVVGGTDLVGDDYTGGSSGVQPDGDPMDCGDNGHGTHVAGTAAGYGVTGSGQTFAGPWQSGLDLASFLVGPGVAPEAQLFAIRIFGCSGTTSFVIPALEWASDPNRDGNFADRLDVVNLSLGSSYGGPDPGEERALDHLVSLGTVVVAAAGNAGDLYTIVGSPSSADNVLSVASCADSGVTGVRLAVDTPSTLAGELTSVAAQFGSPPPADGIAATVVAAAPAEGCEALTNGASMTGQVALIARGTCNFSVKVKNAQQAGAAAVIVTDNRIGPLVIMSGEDATIVIPSVFVAQTDGDVLRGALPGGVTATLRSANLAATVAPSSSRGPRGVDFVLKPEISAPGEAITSALARSGSAGATFSGTSMATPHVSGAVAVLRQLHPDWSAAELKAALMSTAIPDLPVRAGTESPTNGAGRVGAGRVDVAAAAASTLLAFDAAAPGRVALSFGAVEAVGVVRVRRTVQVTSKAVAAQVVSLAYRPQVSVPGVSVDFPDGAVVNVPAHGSVTFPVELVVHAAAVRANRDPGAAATQDGWARHFLLEASGHVALGIAGGDEVRVPLHAVITPASSLVLDVPPSGLSIGTAATRTELAFRGLALGLPGDDPNAAVAMVSPLDLAWTNPATPPSFKPFGTIRWLGVTSDAPQQGGVGEATVYFGVAVHGPWPTPRDVGITITIDSNRDGLTDWRLETTDFGSFISDGQERPWSSDVYGAKLCSTSTGACPLFVHLNRLQPGRGALSVFGTEVVLLAVPASALSLGPGASQFNFTVSVSPTGSTRSSSSPSLTYDAARPGLSPADGALPGPLAAGATLPLTVDRQAFTERGTPGMLLLVHSNATGARASVVPVSFADCTLDPCPTVTSSVVTATRTVTLSAAPAPGCSPVSHEWDFGDGTPVASGSTATHVYTRPGSYVWRLTVRADGKSCTTSGSLAMPGELRRRLSKA